MESVWQGRVGPMVDPYLTSVFYPSHLSLLFGQQLWKWERRPTSCRGGKKGKKGKIMTKKNLQRHFYTFLLPQAQKLPLDSLPRTPSSKPPSLPRHSKTLIPISLLVYTEKSLKVQTRFAPNVYTRIPPINLRIGNRF